MQVSYREPSSKDELDQLFRLRQKVYQADDALRYMVVNANTHDINSHDLNAWHFGAFAGGEAKGYMRLCTGVESSSAEWVREIAESAGFELKPSTRRFPFQTYYPDQLWSDAFIDALSSKRIGEVGKLAILEEFRTGEDQLHEFVEAFLQYCVSEHQIETGFGSCTLILERFYKRFGFFRAEGSVPFVHQNLPEAVILRFDP